MSTEQEWQRIKRNPEKKGVKTLFSKLYAGQERGVANGDAKAKGGGAIITYEKEGESTYCISEGGS